MVCCFNKSRHRKLFNVLLPFSDKFDQFWAVNRKLMEASGDQDHFKYIPFRCYVDDGYKQKLIKPVTDDGRRKTLQDFLQELFPDNENGKKKFKRHFVVLRPKINCLGVTGTS